ncbi:MAG TPA: DUF4129 domain-containing protein [Dehalococcoidia bacterium]|nr:DUF4129 domain-containing protein [Dehalococcoidia bacterium]
MIRRWRAPLVRGSLILMEALWVYALVAFVVAATVGGGKPTLLGVLVVVGGSFTLSRLLQGSVMSLTAIRIVGATVSLLLFYAVVRIDFYGDFAMWDFHWVDALINHTHAALDAETQGSTAIVGVPLLIFFWMRGILTGQQTTTFEDVLASFALGFGVIAVVLVFGALVDELPRGVELIAVPYVAVGLMALGLQHASQASDSFEREFTPVWLVAITSAVAVMGLIALLFVLVDFGTARDGLEAAGLAIGWVGAGILAIVSWPLIKFLEGVFWLLAHINIYGAFEEAPPQELASGDRVGEQTGRGSDLPQWVDHLVRYTMASMIVIGLAIVMAFLFQRFQKKPGGDDNKESVYTEGRLAADLGNWLGSMFRRHGGGRVVRENEPVRRLYLEMLAAAEERGVERRPSETPLDLAPRLQSTFRSEAPVEITGLFDDVRYGAMEAEEAEVQRLRALFEGLRGT